MLPFGFSASPWVYHFLGEAKVAFLRRYGIGVLAYLDDSFLTNYVSTHGGPPRVQWLAAAEATSVAMLVSYFCGYFLSIKKCDLKPSTLQKYLGIWCDSETATFRVPQERLDKLHARIAHAFERGSISFSMLQSVAGQAMSMAVAVRPASLYTQAMFATISALEKSGRSEVPLALDSSADLRGELAHWQRKLSRQLRTKVRGRRRAISTRGSRAGPPMPLLRRGGGSCTPWTLRSWRERCFLRTGWRVTSTRKKCTRCTIYFCNSASTIPASFGAHRS